MVAGIAPCCGGAADPGGGLALARIGCVLFFVGGLGEKQLLEAGFGKGRGKHATHKSLPDTDGLEYFRRTWFAFNVPASCFSRNSGRKTGATFAGIALILTSRREMATVVNVFPQGKQALRVQTESLKRSIFLFCRISGRKTATHFSWKCSNATRC